MARVCWPARTALDDERIWFWCGLALLAVVSASTTSLFPVAAALPWVATGTPLLHWSVGRRQWRCRICSGWGRVLRLGSAQRMDLAPGSAPIDACGVRAAALVVVPAAFALVFAADYFFKTDFRVWVVAIKTFTPDKIAITLSTCRCSWFTSSLTRAEQLQPVPDVRAGVVQHCSAGGSKRVRASGARHRTVLDVLQHRPYAALVSGITSIWLFPIIVFLLVAGIISRKLYRATGNPYVGAFVNALS